MENRLKELREEYKKGQQRMATFQQETNDLSSNLLRISGAIQIIEELMGDRSRRVSAPSSNRVALAENLQ